MTLPAGASVIARVGGGNINEGYRVKLADGSDAFVKTRADAAPGEYAAEADSLRWLAEAGALRTPAVLDVDERYLALAWIASSFDEHASSRRESAASGTPPAAGAEALGSGLARLHAAGAPFFGAPARGPRAHARFGPLLLSNEPTADWAGFYAQRRLQPLGRLAVERGALSAGAARALDSVCARLDRLCGAPEPPARLHGDLWSGNVLAGADGRAWLIDPSAYGGHREVDLAMLALFGAPSLARTLGAYQEHAPLADGWRERVALYQLLPLLVHALLFGGGYSERVERALRHYA